MNFRSFVLLTLLALALPRHATAAPPVVQFDASGLSLSNGATVAGWGFQTAGGTPTFQTGQTPNGKAAVEFNGTDRMGDNQAVSFSSAQDFIYVAVIKPVNTGAYHNLFEDDPGARPMLWIDGSFRYEFNFGGTTRPAAGTGPGGWDIVIADARLNQLYVNTGTSPVTGGGATPYASGKNFDFFHRDSGSTFQGRVAEVRVYNNRADFGGSIATLYEELRAKWILQPPTVSSVAPASGSVTGLTSITLTGTNFVSPASVTVGGAAATNVVVVDATHITAITPPGTLGTASVEVTTGAGSSVANSLFTYVTPSTDATLQSLALSRGVLTPALAAGTLSYAANVPATTTKVQITPVASHPNATATVNGGSPQIPVSLDVGDNIVAVQVTAEDGTTTQTYTVVITKEAPVLANVVLEQPAGIAVPGPGVRAWGRVAYPILSVPAGLQGVSGLAANMIDNAAALLTNGTAMTWGRSNGPPAGLPPLAKVAPAGEGAVALTRDGSATSWGSYLDSPPASLIGVVDVAAGYFHAVALKSDGTVVAWGLNEAGTTNVPAGLAGVTAIAAGSHHTLALKSNGTVVAWGYNNKGQSTVPAGLSGVVAIAAQQGHSLALKGDGTVVAWGDNTDGQSTVPAGLTGVVAIATGGNHALALKGDGTVAGWGLNGAGQCTVPAGLTGVTAIAPGSYHSVALKSDGTVVVWGNSTPSAGLAADTVVARAIAATNSSTLAITLPRLSFPITDVGVSSTPKTFTLRSTGSAALQVSSVSLNGPHAADFILSASTLPGSVAAGGQADFSITFQPTALGTRQAVLQIVSNDPEEGLLEVHLTGGTSQPEIAVFKGTGTAAANALTVGVDAGLVLEAAVGGSRTQTFTIQNLGSGLLNGLSATLTGAGAAQFTLTQPAGAPLGFAATTTFSVTYTPTTVGQHSATLLLASNDADENPFEIPLHGTAIAAPGAPEIAVFKGSSTSGADALTDNVDAGLTLETTVGTSRTQSFTLQNQGQASLTGLNATLTGTGTAQFTLSQPAATTLGLNATTTFSVTYTPTAAGQHNATLLLASNDADENPFEIVLHGTTSTGIPPATGILTVVPTPAGAPTTSGVVTWGDISAPPAGLEDVTAISGGDRHALALKADGTVVAWGDNGFGQLDVPAGLTGVTAISAGTYHSLAVKSDGTVVAWGNNGYGQTLVPAGLGGVVAVAAGYTHSLALKTDGTVVAWGQGDYGQLAVPAGLTGVTAIGTGYYQCLALKSDGTVVHWGYGGSGMADIPAGLTGVIAISAGYYFNAALKANGTVVAWGDNSYGQTNLPAGLTGVTAISAGGTRCLALKSDGSVVGWGDADLGGVVIPPDLGPATAVASTFGGRFAMALMSGSAVSLGQAAVGSTGQTQTFAIRNSGAAALALSSVTLTGLDAADFTLNTTGMQSPLAAPTGETTVSVTFHPSVGGLRKTALRVVGLPAGGTEEVVVEVSLSGTGLVPDLAVFTAATATGPERVSGGGLQPISAGTTQVFTVSNPSQVPLTGLAASLSGTGAVQFSLSGPAATTLAAGESTTVSVTYAAGATTTQQATLQIDSSDPDENPFLIALEGQPPVPEIAVFTGSTTAAGAARSSGSGLVELQVGQSQTFTVLNEGGAPLSGLAATLSGLNAAQFTLSGPALSLTSLAPGASTAVTVTYTTGATAAQQATLQIASNDADENPFVIPLQGEAVGPEIAVFTGSTTAAGTARTSGSGLVDLLIGQSQTFTVLNEGNGTLTGLAAALSGSDATQFTLSGPALSVTSLAPGASTTFSVAYAPGATGPHLASVQLASNDADENPFTILLRGRPPTPGFLVAEAPAGTNLADGSVVSWGAALYIITPDAPITGVKALALGNQASIALREDGTVTAWGSNAWGQLSVPPGLSGVTAIAASRSHCLALKSDGTVVGWGTNSNGQATAPAGITDAVAIAAGEVHSLVLRSNGTVTAWGLNDQGQTSVPAGLTGVTAIAAGYKHSVALKSDGTIVCWGLNSAGQLNVPAGLSGVTAISAGEGTTLALKSDGTVACWGWTSHGQNVAPAGLSDVVDISAGYQHCVALRRDGTLVIWGRNDPDKQTLPAAFTRACVLGKGPSATHIAIVNDPTLGFGPQVAASATRTITLRNTGESPLSLTSVTLGGANAGDFTLDTTGMATSLAGGASTTLTVTFTPTVLGSRSAVVQVETGGRLVNLLVTGISQGSDIAVYSGTTIAVDGEITDGGATQLLRAEGGESQTRTFTITNTTGAQLTGLAATLTGGGAAQFSLTQPGLASLGLNETTTFTVTYAPAANGTHQAVVQISSNDADENPFDIPLEGRPPKMTLADDTGAELPYGASLGFVGHALATHTRTFTLRNDGRVPLTGLAFQFTGAGAAAFTGTAAADTSLAVGQSTTVTLRYAPGTSTNQAASLQVTCDNPEISPITLFLSGAATGSSLLNFEVAEDQLPTYGDRLVTTPHATLDYLGAPGLYADIEWENEVPFQPLPVGYHLTARDSEVRITADPGTAIQLHSCMLSNSVWYPSDTFTRILSLKILDGDTGEVLFEESNIYVNRRLPFPFAYMNLPARRSMTIRIVEEPVDRYPIGIDNISFSEVPAAQPHLVVSQPEDTPLTVGGSRDFGSLTVGAATNAYLPFTLGNTGSATFTGLQVTKLGADEEQFVVSPVPGSIAAGGTGTFLVAFRPTSAGDKTITLRITSNDPFASPYDITLTGTGLAPSTPQQSWRQAYFGSSANAGAAADNYDADGDGVVNLLEFAFGTNPGSSASGPAALGYGGTFAGGGTVMAAGQPKVAFESAGNGVDFRAMFMRRKDHAAAGLGYTVEFSADLVTWEASTATPTVLADDGTHQAVSVPYVTFINGKKARFFRVVVGPAS
ncbi:MAG: choice-of-anchor D domain-containing protein [Prosthecobacter sp.]